MPHINDKIDYCVETFIVYKNRVLLRKHDKYGIWISVGGHIELDEDPNQAAIREVKEEVGLDIELYKGKNYSESKNQDGKELIPPQFMHRHKISDSHEHIAMIYFAKTNTDKLVLSETEKSNECRWFKEEELDSPLYGIKKDIKRYAKSALKKLSEY